MLRFTKSLLDFLASNADFRIVYSSSTVHPLATPNTSRIVILDSSFNPPHLAHYKLAKEALDFNYNGTVTPRSNLSLLLLLSVKNADKLHPSPAAFDQRLEMMFLMAKYLENQCNVHVSIGLTNHARFIDKSVAIILYLKNYFAQDYQSIKLTFAVGFDTLERILNPKYYLPDKLLDTLSEFMKATDLLCLTRAENRDIYTQQVEYLRNLRHGKIPDVPEALMANVHVLSAEEGDKIGQISSTAVRKAFVSGEGTTAPVIPEIREFIQQNELYL